MLSATAITSSEPITLAFGLPEVISPKIIPKLVTVDDVAPKVNLLGSLGNFTKLALRAVFLWLYLVCTSEVIFTFLLLDWQNKATFGTILFWLFFVWVVIQF